MALSIASLARSKKRSGMVRPSAFALRASSKLVTVRSPVLSKSLASGNGQLRALDGRLGLRVENMKPGRPHGNAQLVGHPHPRGRLDARHHDALADLHIEQDFRAELIDHLNHSVEARVVEISATRHSEVLRPHTEYDLAPDMAAQALRDLVRQLDAQAGVLGDQRSVRLGHR